MSQGTIGWSLSPNLLNIFLDP